MMMTWRIVVVFGVMVQHDDVLLVKRRWCCLVGGRWIIGLYGISFLVLVCLLLE